MNLFNFQAIQLSHYDNPDNIYGLLYDKIYFVFLISNYKHKKSCIGNII